MSLYNALFGESRFADTLLAMLGLTKADVPRYRDCYFDADGNIVIHTRTGGGNRDDYEAENAALASNRFYLRDSDDDFDSTYADFTFSVPPEYAEAVKPLLDLGTRNPAEAWQRLFSAMQSGDDDDPEVKRALSVGRRVLAPVVAFLEGKGESR